MKTEEMVAIRVRDSRVSHPRTWAERDRCALVQEHDRVRDLWERCRDNCFDKTILETREEPGDTLGL